MKITTEADINGQAARWLRNRAGMSQAAFWATIGLKQPTGSHYEGGENEIPAPARILIFIKYVVGLEIDAATDAGVAELQRLAILQEADKAGVEHVGTALADAITHMKIASRALKSIHQ